MTDNVLVFLLALASKKKKKKVWKQNVESNSIGDGVKITVSR